MPFTVQSFHRPKVLAKHFGHIQEVVDGGISQERLAKRLDARDFSCGFELASPQKASSLGESVIVNALCYTTSTDQESGSYGQLIFGEQFIPGDVFLLPKGALPTHQVVLENATLPFYDFYAAAYQAIEGPFAFAGIFHFSSFSGVAIGRPPIHKENIFAHQEKYYPFPEVHKQNISGYVIGVVSARKTLQEDRLDSLLYDNPMDQPTELIHHAHVLTLRKHPSHVAQISPKIGDECLHLLHYGCKIEATSVELYALQGVEEYR